MVRGSVATTPRAHVTELRAVLQAAPEVLVAYLFGSEATGAARPDSDVDVAVLMDDALPAARRLSLMADLREVVPSRRLDLLLLDGAPPAVAYRVLRDGILLLVRDEGARVTHHAQVLDRYFDTEPLRRELDRAQRRRLAEDRFGRA